MKKIAIIFFVLIIIVIMLITLIHNNQTEQEKVRQENKFYESYLNKPINGTELATVINKAMDSNYKNDVNQDENNNFINNDTNSINIDLKMIDIDKTYSMETIYNGQVNNFVSYYSNILFECKKIEYHSNTGKVKYMLFEQITY